MLLPELKQLASSLGLRGTGSMRKGALIEAIKAQQTGGSAAASGTRAPRARAEEAPTSTATAPETTRPEAPQPAENGSGRSGGRAERTRAQRAEETAPAAQPTLEAASNGADTESGQ
ncbi:Rho termination factor N-terminal domain-containing protein, partial [Desertihabitans aurantiacus]|uniref:Rho termination factor N-terminal domain-containing protein n=1 Tax=Desertihabitans aurantiacus TaxID=2282477 RepID=UPI0018E54538